MKNSYLITNDQWSTLLAGLLILVTFWGSYAWAIDVAEIVDKANEAAYYQGFDGKASAHMSIVDSQGREREREFVILRHDLSEDLAGQKFYLYFNRPADVNKTAFMVWKNIDRDDDRWLYLPALDLVKRIASSDKRTSFVGSHFFYEDVSGRNPAEDNHELIEETNDFYVVQSTPKDPNSVEFNHYKVWVHKTSFIPVKIEYFDSEGDVYRTYETLKVETIQDFITVIESRVTDTRIGGYTTLTFSDVSYNIGIGEDIFSERYLREAPRRLLR